MDFGHRFMFALVVLSAVAFAAGPVDAGKQANPIVRMITSMGVIELELDAGKAPLTVANFVKYAEDGFYNGTLFHRVKPKFMIQGGGLLPGLKDKPTREPIKNEAGNALKNVKGSIAMARTSDPHSATSEFFINTVDNAFLDKDKAADGWGYTVFGKVTKGMDVVKRIEAVATGVAGGRRDVPKEDVLIKKVEVVKTKQ